MLDNDETERAFETGSQTFRINLAIRPSSFSITNCSSSGASVRQTRALKSRSWSAIVISSKKDSHGYSNSAKIHSELIEGFTVPPMKRSGGRLRARRPLAVPIKASDEI